MKTKVVSINSSCIQRNRAKGTNQLGRYRRIFGDGASTVNRVTKWIFKIGWWSTIRVRADLHYFCVDKVHTKGNRIKPTHCGAYVWVTGP